MSDRTRSALDDVEILEETPRPAISEAEAAACTCPELCIRDHEHE